jgi:hypothetical protein
MKSSIIRDVTPCSLLKSTNCFGGTCHHLEGLKIAKQETSVKQVASRAVGLPKILDCIRNRREMQDKSFRVGPPIEQNELIGSQAQLTSSLWLSTQLSDPMGDEQDSHCGPEKGCIYTGLGKNWGEGEVVRVWWPENQGVHERNHVCGS